MGTWYHERTSPAQRSENISKKGYGIIDLLNIMNGYFTRFRGNLNTFSYEIPIVSFWWIWGDMANDGNQDVRQILPRVTIWFQISNSCLFPMFKFKKKREICEFSTRIFLISQIDYSMPGKSWLGWPQRNTYFIPIDLIATFFFISPSK